MCNTLFHCIRLSKNLNKIFKKKQVSILKKHWIFKIASTHMVIGSFSMLWNFKTIYPPKTSICKHILKDMHHEIYIWHFASYWLSEPLKIEMSYWNRIFIFSLILLLLCTFLINPKSIHIKFINWIIKIKLLLINMKNILSYFIECGVV